MRVTELSSNLDKQKFMATNLEKKDILKMNDNNYHSSTYNLKRNTCIAQVHCDYIILKVKVIIKKAYIKIQVLLIPVNKFYNYIMSTHICKFIVQKDLSYL